MPPRDYVSIDALDAEHRNALTRAVRNVLATDLALTTYAQIIDGLPIGDIAWDTRGTKITPAHPINSHVGLCQGALEKAIEFRGAFNPDTLIFKPEVLNAYQLSSPSSPSFNLRLIELTASAIHQIAVLLMQLNLRLHDPATTEGLDVDHVTAWERPLDQWARVVPYPTLFSQSHFIGHAQYPDGVADIAGYWAEDRIMGLLGEQQDKLLNFLLGSDPQHAHTGVQTGVAESNGPLPILPHSGNRVRIDQDNAISVHQVYRDLWERAPPGRRLRMQEDMDMDRCVVTELDYPELDFEEQMRRLDELRDHPPPS
ncbi:hypothetical protein QQZ08_008348 [Neonectria magnoliae]|uniref:Uncharacterized protein n=1 Tax=Neonectria magnoliae TaxID=2732573 RepID=A0ABR1HW68_9HYPO